MQNQRLRKAWRWCAGQPRGAHGHAVRHRPHQRAVRSPGSHPSGTARYLADLESFPLTVQFGVKQLCICSSIGAHNRLLHAPAGMNGPICVFLYGPVTNPSPMPFTGHFGQGVITEARDVPSIVCHDCKARCANIT